MKIICCDHELLPHTMGMPKLGDSCADYGCPTCGKQYEITIWQKETYERFIKAGNVKRAAFGLKPESVQVSETR